MPSSSASPALISSTYRMGTPEGVGRQRRGRGPRARERAAALPRLSQRGRQISRRCLWGIACRASRTSLFPVPPMSNHMPTSRASSSAPTESLAAQLVGVRKVHDERGPFDRYLSLHVAGRRRGWRRSRSGLSGSGVGVVVAVGVGVSVGVGVADGCRRRGRETGWSVGVGSGVHSDNAVRTSTAHSDSTAGNALRRQGGSRGYRIHDIGLRQAPCCICRNCNSSVSR